MDRDTENAILGLTQAAQASLMSINDLLARPADPAPDTTLPTPDEESEEPRGANLTVGYAEGSPGETVIVEILGDTTERVGGFGMYIGCDPALKLIKGSSEVTDKLLGLFEEVKDPEDIINQATYGTTQTNFLAIFVGFFGEVTDAEDTKRYLSELAAIKAKLKAEGRKEYTSEELSHIRALMGIMNKRHFEKIVIPPDTPMFRMALKIPDDAEVGHSYKLDNRSWYYGKPRTSGPDGRVKILRTNNIFTNDGQGLYPELTSGWVEVK